MRNEYQNPIYNVSPSFVLCGSSALEFMHLFVGYLSDQTIYVYKIGNVEAVPPEYTVVPLPEGKISYSERDGVKYTTFDQTINDMLLNKDLEDPQAIMEALNDYMYVNNGKDPCILLENISKYNYYKKESNDYYNEG